MTPTTVTAPAMPRYATTGLRLKASPTQPLFIYNVYPAGAEPELISDVVKLWPKDLLPYLAIQIVPNEMDKLDAATRARDIDVMLDASDEVQIPVILQTLTLFGSRAPDAQAIDTLFDDHPSLVGLGAAELSADFNTAISGISDAQKTALAANIEQTVRHDGVLVWADMGYFAPQVFIGAGADKTLYDLMAEHHENMIIQVKQNGSGRRFGTQSAAFGMYLAGLADTWGLNSEDWLWWEASLQRLGADQVPGGLTAAGMTRSEFQTRTRFTYPEALFGIEMLTIAASGGSVFSIEAPERGTIDPQGTHKVSPAGLNVVFPVLRRIVHGAMIPSKEAVAARVRLALHPETDNDPAFADDQVFSKLYGPQGCADADRMGCAQRQWVPKSGRYGIVPTLPVLAGADVTDRFAKVLTPSEALALPNARLRADATTSGAHAKGDSWAAPAVDGVWFAANPFENNVDTTTTFTLPKLANAGDVTLGGTLDPYAFVIADGRGAGLTLLVDNYRTDSDRLWRENISEKALGAKPLDSFAAAPRATTMLTLAYPPDSKRPKVTTKGGTVTQTWNDTTATLTLKIRHRGPVELSIN